MSLRQKLAGFSLLRADFCEEMAPMESQRRFVPRPGIDFRADDRKAPVGQFKGSLVESRSKTSTLVQ